ncbi:sulfur carrier protein ThiS [Piscinibacter sakaiensis]|uniref:sulfur carrier protein ThiS n=1 Tax=Piscinibacter sakaiensis TaxID=1547922 RepID=UPI003AAE74E9
METVHAITIQLDGKPQCIADGSSLAALVESLGHAPNAVATALNGQFIARSQRETQPLREGDAVLLFQPIVGG